MINFVRGGVNFNVENNPTCNFAPHVVIKYKRHWDRVGSNFNVEKWPYMYFGSTCSYEI